MAHTLAVVIVETRAFTARIGDLLSDEEYRRLQVHLLRRPPQVISFQEPEACERSVGARQGVESVEGQG
jgi:hypothetical protein